MLSSRRSNTIKVVAVVAAVFTLTGVSPSRTQRAELPTRLADSTFWRIVTSFSEPSGFFTSENFVSNETEWQYVIPGLLDRVRPASAYLGVGPEQNFTYIAAFQPKIAFICDIRRQNLVQHLMYKALFEMSSDRADFLSKLWSRKRADGLDSSSTPADLVTAFRAAKPDSFLYNLNLGAIFSRLVNTHNFALSSEDSSTMRAVYAVFFADGPDISYSSSSRGGGVGSPFSGAIRAPSITSSNGMTWIAGNTGVITINNGLGATTYRFTTDANGALRIMRDSAGVLVPDTTLKLQAGSPINFGSFAGRGMYATFASLMTEDDGAGVNRGWLGSEAAFRWIKDFESRNLVVPVVGNFGGPKALRAIGGYLREHGARVSAFYTSNVEQYLFQNAINGAFYDNVATMPADSSSVFIRSFPNQFRSTIMPRNPGARLAQTTSSIDEVLRVHRAGTLMTYPDLARLQER